MGDGRSVDEEPRVGMQVPALTPVPLVLSTALSNPLAESNGVDFIDTLDYDVTGLPEASAIHNFLKPAVADLQRELRWRVQPADFGLSLRELRLLALALQQTVAQQEIYAYVKCSKSGSSAICVTTANSRRGPLPSSFPPDYHYSSC